MGQLESLRESDIAQPTKKIKNILPWLFHLIGIPMIFEVLILILK
jgi:hypothetical protein